jgi:hypothetical protein
VTATAADAARARLRAEHEGEARRRYSRPLWWLLQALDRLPAPTAERAVSALFVARSLVRPRPLTQAWGWAAAHRSGPWARARLVLELLSYQGRFVARSALLGLCRVARLSDMVTVRGAEQLAAFPGAKILVGFHLGAPCGDLVLRVRGFEVTWIGGARASRGWERAWRDLGAHDVDHLGQLSEKARLYEAHRRVARAGTIYLNGDGFHGRRAFTVPVLGGKAPITAGWLALRSRTRAPAFPVLSHAEGRRVIVTIYPPLPPPQPDSVADAAACRAALAPILGDFVRRHPEQCLLLAFRDRGRPRARAGGGVRRPRRAR